MAQQNILLKSVTKLMLIFSIIYLVDCSKDDDERDGGTAANGTVVAKYMG